MIDRSARLVTAQMRGSLTGIEASGGQTLPGFWSSLKCGGSANAHQASAIQMVRPEGAMLRIRDIMTREVLTLAPDMSLRDATELLTMHHVSGAPVVDGRKVVGVLSASDLLEAAGEEADGREQQSDEEDLWEREPNEEGPAGFFDIAGDDGEEELSDLMEAARGMTAERRVEDVMTRTLYTLPSSADVTAAADYLRRCAVHRILVVDGGTLVGIVSSMDIVRAVAEHKLEVRRFVFDTVPPA
jgi:CBS domain-containing protein